MLFLTFFDELNYLRREREHKTKQYLRKRPILVIFVRNSKSRYLLILMSVLNLSFGSILYVGHLWVKVTNIVTRAATNFQLFGHYSNKNQDNFLKFSAFVHHMGVLN